MGKRSTFKRAKGDRYLTPWAPVADLARHLPARFRFAEPCAADGRLIDHLRRLGGSCVEALDLNPGRGDVQQGDALRWAPRSYLFRKLDFIITNPPWTRVLLHQMIRNFSWFAPTWLLFDADWLHTIQAAPFLRRLVKVVSVGRVKWIEGSKHTGKDNCAWYLFDANHTGGTEFIGRAA